MGRFDHLELGDFIPAPLEENPNGVIIDQHYYLEKAKEAFLDESYERALAYYSRALQYDLNIEEAWVGQIRCLTELKEFQEATMWSLRSMERFFESPDVLSARAVAEARMGRSVPAIGFSDGALALKGVTAYCWYARGEVLLSSNQKNAKSCFSKAIEAAPSDWSIRLWIAKSYINRDEYHLALEHLTAAVRIKADQFNCWYWIGRCSEELGDLEDAQNAYNRAIACQPNFNQARAGLERVTSTAFLDRVSAGLRRIFKG